ncbi:hypothetical protein B0H11DRAFT_67518 [Mycena galericulata]|nr:hypothetical protein B0H11DRAFT_67518 [Mycena galericulata]
MDTSSDLVSLRSKCKHFRVLVMGRPNAGKTTLLKKVCDSTKDPEIFNPRGKRLGPEVIRESNERGLHDIDNELIFTSNPQYIFHDSRGFESGSLDDVDKVKSFITERANSNSLSEQLHAIWYCFAADTNRPMHKVDEYFFGTAATGKVPVIAILTKCEAVDSAEYQKLRRNGGQATKALAKQNAQEVLDERFVKLLKGMAHPPADYVQVEKMHKDGDCKQLITKTAGALTNDVLRLLFVSVQQNNIDLCMFYGVEYNMRKAHVVVSSREGIQNLVREVLAWFPHTWASLLPVHFDR